MELPPRVQEAFDQVQRLLEQYPDAFGPDDDELEGRSRDQLRLTEWIVITNWIDMDDGEGWVEGHAPKHMYNSHIIGLLTMALDMEMG